MIKIRIGIVDDHSIVRSGLRQYFEDESDLQVVGEASSGGEAIDLVRKTEMDVLLMDLSMPGQSGIDALHSSLERENALRAAQVQRAQREQTDLVARAAPAGLVAPDG